MILHSISPYETASKVKDTSARFVGTYGTTEHKRFIHNRVLDNCVWNEGDSCSVNGNIGLVIHVYKEDEFDSVHWRDLECQCVEVFLYASSDTVMCHPSTLRTR